MRNVLPKFFFFLLLIAALLPWNVNQAQVQRNPVIEACTGTWCQYCPCGHDIIDNILISMPNAIAVEYHGPLGYGDPWEVYNGNEIIGMLGFSSYPTGIVDRTSGPQSRSAWPGLMNTRFNVPANVDITMDKNYNKLTRELNVTIHSTAQTNLTGEYKLSFIILESGLVYNQSGNASCIGGPNYVHNHVVRSMINGAQGDALNGANPWNSGSTISKNIQYSVPAGYNADNCELVAFVYKVNSPFNMGEIQQGEKWPLVSPDYVATIGSTSSDVMTTINTSADFDITIRNQGFLEDTYYVEGMIDGPAAWTGQFTTSHGSFNFGQMDSIDVASGDSVQISTTINPNGAGGFAYITLRFTSKNDPGVIAEAKVRLITTTGVDYLIVDASGSDHALYIDSSLSRVAGTASYGIVSHEALDGAAADISHYYAMAWVVGNKVPVLSTADVTLIQEYLDQGGRLLITGQDLGADVFEPAGQSQFASDFYHNYLHANYVLNVGPTFFITGLPDDPIGDGIVFPTNTVYPRSLDEIAPYDTNATGVFQYSNGPSLIGIKAEKDDYRVAYYAFGLEQISSAPERDSIVLRSFNWLMEGVVTGIDNNETGIVLNYSLNQNYPNPFNPSTIISYSVASAGNTTIKIYDVMGREVSTLVNGYRQPGIYNVSFDASSLSSGMYIYKLVSGNYSASRKMLVLK